MRLTALFTRHVALMPKDENNRVFADWGLISEVLRKWHWSRKPLASTINILSVALYDLFGANGLLSLFLKKNLPHIDNRSKSRSITDGLLQVLRAWRGMH